MTKKECVALILAGGQGSRLGALTKSVAKPAVQFGGKYRIIDFPLSNCAHSGIDTVGVLTQYQPLELNTYIANGATWDLDRNCGGVYVLPPFMSSSKSEWYKGTANAIYQNISFVEQYSPDYVIILSGDHIYKMKYEEMLAAHKKSGASATIAVMPVPWEITSQFGIMDTDETGTVVEFEEKPSSAKSNLASMGIYVFNWQRLKKHLIIDENNVKSSNDFGKNLIPQMLAANEKIMTYPFDGYWRDVGTVKSLWSANMDILSDNMGFNLAEEKRKIFSRNPIMPPHFVGEGASIKNSSVTSGCQIYGEVEHSILSNGVIIEKGASVTNSVIMSGALIKENAKIDKAIIGANTQIGKNCQIGITECMDNKYYSDMCENGIVLIGNDIEIDDGITIAKESMIDRDITKDEDIFCKADIRKNKNVVGLEVRK